MTRRRIFTSESVTEGHPDKICDAISDAVLDAHLAIDKNARVACEAATGENFVLVFGEITSSGTVDIEPLVRNVIRKIGYTDEKSGINPDTCEVVVRIKEQSKDIALGVDNSKEFKGGGETYDKTGAGDQGMMFGFACDETSELMPLPIQLAHQIAKRLAEVRKNGEIDGILPDGKCQVTVEYEGYKPVKVDAVVVSNQHTGSKDLNELRTEIIEKVIKKTVPAGFLSKDTKCFINETGRFEIGGPMGDCGLTGRKIVVDTYGGYCTHGGGAFSGKDPTKVDRSAAYMARYICKNIVAAGLASRVQLAVSYAIGVAKPVSVFIDSFGTGKLNDEDLQKTVEKVFDLRPAAIIDKLGLRNPIYSLTSAYGHFGKDELPWEKTDMVQALKRAAEAIK